MLQQCVTDRHCDPVGIGFPVPDGPGLGVSYDWDLIERNRTAHHVFE